MATTSSPAKPLGTRALVATAIGAALLILIANSAFWFNNYIFNTTNFTNTTTQALLSESSRTAIAGQVVSKALQNRPALQKAVEEPATKLISGLLDSNVAKNLVQRSVTRLQIAITSKNPQPIEINLEPVKENLTRLLDIAQQITNRPADEAKFNPEDIPNTITLVDVTKLPNIYLMGTILIWLGPICLLIAIGLIAWPLYTYRAITSRLHIVLGIQAVAIGLGWVTALLIGPLFRPPILAQVPDENLRVVAENIYNAFIATFNNQTNSMLLIAVFLLIAAVVSWYYHTIYKSRRST